MVDEGAIEKVLNSLGKKLAMDYYGLDLHFTVLGFEDGVVKVKTDKPIPQIFDVKIEPNFTYGKYGTINDLNGNLEHLLKYVGLNNVHIHYPEQQYVDHFINTSMTTDYIRANPHEFIKLDSVGSIVNIKSGYVYPILTDLSMSHTYGVSLADIESEDFWDALSETDKQKLNDIYS